MAKPRLYATDDPAARAAAQRTLVEVLETTMRLLHPFMPFLTEEIWQRLPGAGPSIMIAPFPKAGRAAGDAEAEARMDALIAIVGAIRAMRSESRISPATELIVTLRPGPGVDPATVAEGLPLMRVLARAAITVDPAAERPAQSAVAVAGGCEVFVQLAGVIDLDAERQRLRREIERAEKEIGFLQGKLGRPEFVERAPAEIVERERARLGEQEQVRGKLAASLAALS
jgi:valyl-tRNA synthetase